MKVLGIDPGLASCAWALIESEPEYRLVSYGEIKTSSKNIPSNNPLPQRLKIIYDGLKKILLWYRPDVVCVEAQFYSKIAKSIINTYLAVSIIYLLCGILNFKIEEIPAKSVKLGITGYGGATKKQIKRMIKLLLNNEKEIHNEHVNDAIAVALCFLNTKRMDNYV
jgi:crossover junction endodeoxyribonuclease RuvC